MHESSGGRSPPGLLPADAPEVVARIKEALDLVDMLARQMRRQCGRTMALEDLASQGREALVMAARSYDPSYGVSYRRWANIRVRGAMIDAVRSQGELPRRVYRQLKAMQAADRIHDAAAEDATPLTPEAADAKLSEQLGSAAMAMALGFLHMRRGDSIARAVDPGVGPEETVGNAELLQRVREAIAERPEAERKLLERHYFDEVTLDDAGKELGLSKSWASRLHARAIEAVAKAMRRARPPGEPE